MTQEEVIQTGKKVWGAFIGWTATAIGIIGGLIAIYSFWQSNPRYDLSGQWNLANTIETTSYTEYRNLKLGYRLFLTQRGTALTGTGEKWTENGRSLPPSAHAHINLTGSVSGNKVIATFQEDGADRKTEGTLDWTFDPKTKSLVGKFTSTAANASGPSTAQIFTE